MKSGYQLGQEKRGILGGFSGAILCFKCYLRATFSTIVFTLCLGTTVIYTHKQRNEMKNSLIHCLCTDPEHEMWMSPISDIGVFFKIQINVKIVQCSPNNFHFWWNILILWAPAAQKNPGSTPARFSFEGHVQVINLHWQENYWQIYFCDF